MDEIAGNECSDKQFIADGVSQYTKMEFVQLYTNIYVLKSHSLDTKDRPRHNP